MKKALIVATVVGFIANFEYNDILILQRLGYEVHVAADMSDCNNKNKLNRLLSSGALMHDIKFYRNPFKFGNIIAYKELKTLAKKEKFDILHCHTPVGGVLGRAVGHYTKVSQVLYTAHGFHFFNGAPLKNWLLFYPIEKFCSRWADIQITINNEDYERAQTFHTKIVKRIHGVGIDIDRFNQERSLRHMKRDELRVKDDEIVLLSVGQLHPDKNHRVVIDAMKTLNSKYKYFICGVGALKEKLERYISANGLEDRVSLLNYRTDIPELLQAADIFVFPSLFEGLSVALMEAVAARLPIACSEVRGNVDTVITPESYFPTNSPQKVAEVIERINSMTEEEKTDLAEINYQNLLKYRLSEVQKEMRAIYKSADEMVEKARKIV